MTDEQKPAPIVVAPGGIDAHRPMSATPPQERIARHPPFQMFIAERETAAAGVPADRFAFERLRAHGPALLAEYETWFGQKGLWPHETPYGEPR